MNECKPRFLGVAVMHWARPMAAELRDSRSERRQGSSSSVREKKVRRALKLEAANHAAASSFAALGLPLCKTIGKRKLCPRFAAARF